MITNTTGVGVWPIFTGFGALECLCFSHELRAALYTVTRKESERVMSTLVVQVSGGTPQITEEHYRLGYHECLSETMHFLVEVEGMFAGDKLCVQLISHLQRHCDKILKGKTATFLVSLCQS